MIPIRDDAPRYSTPYVTYTLLALNILVFLFELSLPGPSREQFMYQFGMLPAHVTGSLVGVPGTSFAGAFITVITSMFLHASWMHLIFNMLFLHIFGDNIEDYLGHFRFLVFYLLSGFGAALAHILMNPSSTVPSVGASGAIAGVMGAYFVLYPSARVLTLVPFFFIFFVWLPAWVMLGYWFIGQFLSGAATAIAYASQTSGGGIAFWAHVGGFVVGVGLIKLFPTRPRRYRYFYR
jgi:rhomboid family protein